MLKRPLNYAERWFHDGIAVSRPPAFVEVLEIDMLHAKALIGCARAQGLRLTYLHLLIWAAAQVLSADGRLQRLLCGTNLVEPECPDIAISIAGEASVSPVLTIEAAHNKSLSDIAQEVQMRAPEVLQSDRKLIHGLKRFGWLVPSGVLRRALLRLLRTSPHFRRKGAGTFQISMLPKVDLCFTPVFFNTAILTAGRVCDRVIALGGKPVVHPTMIAACSADHRLCDGKVCQEFLVALRDLLESPDLALRAGLIMASEEQLVGARE